MKEDIKLRPVVMLASGHKPFDTRIFVKQARTLVRNGYPVTIILPHTGDEEREGVVIAAVSQSESGFVKLFIQPWRIFWKALKQSSDSIYCIHDSDILIAGVLLKVFGRTVIYDAHEDTPLQISYQHWIPRLLKKPYAFLYYCLERFCGWLFDAIIVAEPVIAKYFPERKTFLVRNFPIAEQFIKKQETSGYTLRKDILLYVGTLSVARGLFEMCKGAAKAMTQIDFEFVLGGQFTPLLLQQQVLDQYKVTFLKWVSYDKLLQLLFDAKVGIIIPNPVERYKTNYPVKMFEFMAAGLPVIASSEGESAAFIKEAQCGILVDPLNVDEISDAIVWLFRNPEEAAEMGRRGRDLIMTRYNWEMESKTLLEVYGRLARRSI